MDTAALLIVPSVSAIAIKILILWLGRQSLRRVTPWAWSFFIALFGMNIVELIGFVFQARASDAIIMFFLKSYYAFAIVSGISFLAVSLQLSNYLSRFINATLLIVMAIGMIVLFLPGVGLVGAASINYSYTRVPGPLYWVLQIIIPIGWLLGLGALVFIMHNGRDWFARRRACAMLIACAPTGLSLFGIIVLMQLGFKLNATLVFSIATNFLFAILIYTEYEYRLFRFLSSIPTTNESGLVNQAIKAIVNNQEKGLSCLTKQFELALIRHSLQINKDNKSKTARMLGISRATLNRKILACD